MSTTCLLRVVTFSSAVRETLSSFVLSGFLNEHSLRLQSAIELLSRTPDIPEWPSQLLPSSPGVLQG